MRFLNFQLFKKIEEINAQKEKLKNQIQSLNKHFYFQISEQEYFSVDSTLNKLYNEADKIAFKLLNSKYEK